KNLAEERTRLETRRNELLKQHKEWLEKQASGNKDAQDQLEKLKAERAALEKRASEVETEAEKLKNLKAEQAKLAEDALKLKAEQEAFAKEKAAAETAHKAAEEKLSADAEKLKAERAALDAKAAELAKGKTGTEVRLSWSRFLFPDAPVRGNFMDAKGQAVQIELEPDAVRDAIREWRNTKTGAKSTVGDGDVIRIKSMQPEGWLGWGKRMAFRVGTAGVLGWRQSDSYLEIRGENARIFDSWLRGEISKLPADFKVELVKRFSTGDLIRPWRWFRSGQTLTNSHGQIDRMVNEAYETARGRVQDFESRPAEETKAPEPEAKGEAKPEAKTGDAEPKAESKAESKGGAEAKGEGKAGGEPSAGSAPVPRAPGAEGGMWTRFRQSSFNQSSTWGRVGNGIFGPLVAVAEGRTAWKILKDPKSSNAIPKGTTVVAPSLNGTMALTGQYDAASLEAERTKFREDMDALKKSLKAFEENPPKDVVLREQMKVRLIEREKELRGMEKRLEAPVMENETDALMLKMGVYQSTRRFRRDAAGKLVCDDKGNPIEDTFIVVDPHKYQKALTHIGKAGSGGMMLRGALQGSKPMMKAGGKVFLAFYALGEAPDIAQKFADGDTAGAIAHTGKTGLKTALMTNPYGMAVVAVWDTYDETDKVIDDLYASLPRNGRKFVLTVPDSSQPGGVRVVPTTEENLFKQFPTLAGHIMRVSNSTDGRKFPVTAENTARFFPDRENDPISQWIRLNQKYGTEEYKGKSIYDADARRLAATQIEDYAAR
ncbi:MAG: hypothetical protein K2Q01_03030, partial [Rickettsiales bacterium]|nr:hypothetical protein [Rickettsiales bacterium]